jgi:hypothetical protein
MSTFLEQSSFLPSIVSDTSDGSIFQPRGAIG